jgi:hypothetical protein
MCLDQCRSSNFQDLPGYTLAERLTLGKSSNGRTKRTKIFVAVRWQWIALLPVFDCLLGVVTLVGTMWESPRADVPNWKNDPVPLLLNQNSKHNGALDDEHEKGDAKIRLYKSGDKAVLGIRL